MVGVLEAMALVVGLRLGSEVAHERWFEALDGSEYERVMDAEVDAAMEELEAAEGAVDQFGAEDAWLCEAQERWERDVEECPF